MDRCALAYQYHKEGWNCAQSVAGACADLAGRTPEEILPRILADTLAGCPVLTKEAMAQ